MHVQMNVQDKTAWFAHIARCLHPGARLAIWEVCQPRPADLRWPMPWSLDGTDSFVVTPAHCAPRSSRPASPAPSGSNETAWVQAWITRTFANGLPAGPALPMLLDDGYTRVLNYIAGISNGSVEVCEGPSPGTPANSSVSERPVTSYIL